MHRWVENHAQIWQWSRKWLTVASVEVGHLDARSPSLFLSQPCLRRRPRRRCVSLSLSLSLCCAQLLTRLRGSCYCWKGPREGGRKERISSACLEPKLDIFPRRASMCGAKAVTRKGTKIEIDQNSSANPCSSRIPLRRTQKTETGKHVPRHVMRRQKRN